jgi:hypothetical protein
VSKFRVHLKPTAKQYSLRCGCFIERGLDNNPAWECCAAHSEAWHIVSGWIERGMEQQQAVALLKGNVDASRQPA